MTKALETELSALRRGECPDCQEFGFLKGPEAGLSTNIMCANPQCGSRFNTCLPWFAERISEPQPLKQKSLEAFEG